MRIVPMMHSTFRARTAAGFVSSINSNLQQQYTSTSFNPATTERCGCHKQYLRPRVRTSVPVPVPCAYRQVSLMNTAAVAHDAPALTRCRRSQHEGLRRK